MLSGLLASAFLLFGRSVAQTCAYGSGGMQQSGDNNYVIDSFEYLQFTYAINQCTAKGLQDPNYYKYTCSQDNEGVWWVTKTAYQETDCSDDGSEVNKWSNDGLEAGEPGYFNCEGDNTYAAIEISTDSSCGASVKIVGGLGACALNPVLYDAKFYCDAADQRAYVQLYDPTHDNGTTTMCNDQVSYCARWSFTPTCGFAAALGQGTINVYGKYVSCVTTSGGDSNSGDGDGDGNGDGESSAAQFTLVGVVIALIAGLLNH